MRGRTFAITWQTAIFLDISAQICTSTACHRPNLGPCAQKRFYNLLKGFITDCFACLIMSLALILAEIWLIMLILGEKDLKTCR